MSLIGCIVGCVAEEECAMKILQIIPDMYAEAMARVISHNTGKLMALRPILFLLVLDDLTAGNQRDATWYTTVMMRTA